MEVQDKKESMINRIRNAGEDLGVGTREIGEEIARLASEGNPGELKKLFGVYKEWEISNRKKGMSPEQAEKQALKNFDLAAEQAGGDILEFYRKSVDYTPPEE